MRHATDYLTFGTPNRRDYLNITGEVEDFVERSGIHMASASSTRCTSPRRSM
jgi:hypothetical protein